jgi:nucleoside-diphosphate-sugar epimerase
VRVIVTGHKGYIGSALEPALIAAGHAVHGYEGAMHADGNGATVHLAWDTRTDGNWFANISDTTQQLACTERGSRFIFASSLTATDPRDQYDQEKRIGEFIVGSRPDIEAVILRLGAVYGPGTQNKRSAFNAILRQIHNGEQVNLYGNALGRRDFVFIDDAVAAFVAALTAPPGIYDVGTGLGTSLSGATFEAAGDKLCPMSADMVTADHMPSANPARFLPGWAPKVSLNEGIVKTLEWLREHEPAKDMVTA